MDSVFSNFPNPETISSEWLTRLRRKGRVEELMVLVAGVVEDVDEEKEEDEDMADTGCRVDGGVEEGEVAVGLRAEVEESFPLMLALMPLLVTALLATGALGGESLVCLFVVVRLRPPVGESLGDGARDVAAVGESGDPGAGET